MLLQAGAQVNVTDLSSSTPLHLAAYLGYEEVRFIRFCSLIKNSKIRMIEARYIDCTDTFIIWC